MSHMSDSEADPENVVSDKQQTCLINKLKYWKHKFYQYHHVGFDIHPKYYC